MIPKHEIKVSISSLSIIVGLILKLQKEVNNLISKTWLCQLNAVAVVT